MQEINLESGMPDVKEALSRLNNRLYGARAAAKPNLPCAKLIHGYGSSGTGGAIRNAVRLELRTYKRNRVIQGYMTGEEFGPFSQAGRDLAARYPDIKKDRDWARNNDGITVVYFR